MSDGDRPADGQNEAVASQVYADSHAELIRYLQRLCGQRQLAEDLAQDAGLRFFSAMRAQAIGNPRAFLFHVATNLARDQFRREIVASEHAEAHSEWEHAAGADHIAAVRQEVAQVSKVIADLPARARDVLLLSRVEGYSQQEVASRLGIAPKTVENHLTRALALLTQRMRKARVQ